MENGLIRSEQGIGAEISKSYNDANYISYILFGTSKFSVGSQRRVSQNSESQNSESKTLCKTFNKISNTNLNLKTTN